MTRFRPARRTSQSGFTILEVLVAMALLSMSLVVLVNIGTNNLRTTIRAELTTHATFLARAKIIELEDQLREDGFRDNDVEDDGDFEEVGFPEFRWETLIEKVELPANLLDGAEEGENGGDLDDFDGDFDDGFGAGDDPMGMLSGMMGGLMGTIIEPIRLGLEASVRRVVVRVLWDEPGREAPQELELVTFLTDPSRLDLAMQRPADAGGDSGSSDGSSGSTSGSTSGSSSRSGNSGTGTSTGAGASPSGGRR